MKDKNIRKEFRKIRTRRRIRCAARGLPRLSVYHSLKFLYAQVIDDRKGVTMASATSGAKADRGGRASAKNLEDAKKLGKLIAEKAQKAGVTKVVFDRGSHIYHGRLKAVAEAAREAGLKF